MQQPAVQFVGTAGQPVWQLLEPYSYAWTTRASSASTHGNHLTHWKLSAPAGFVWDGASAPRLVWTISGITPGGIYLCASLFHDMLYSCGGRTDRYASPIHFWQSEEEWVPVQSRWSRKTVDRLFGRILKDSGVSSAKRQKAYLAVRAFGWLYWKK